MRLSIKIGQEKKHFGTERQSRRPLAITPHPESKFGEASCSKFSKTISSQPCRNVQVEPHLQPLDNEVMKLRSATASSDAILDVKAGGFWSRGETIFFDVGVTHANSKTNQGKPTPAIFKEQESEKKRKYQQRQESENKRKYQQRVPEVEMGSFTPLICWNQRRDGRIMQNVYEAFSGEIGREGR